MCGISAVILPHENDVYDVILKSLTQLQNRGYDSAGVGYLDNNVFVVEKHASHVHESPIDILHQRRHVIPCKIAMGHTRWATHGSKTDVNSHPHISSDGEVMIVHNGIIENFAALKMELQNDGYSFLSETDSEVIANLIAHACKTMDPLNAINQAMKRLQGTWGCVIMLKSQPSTVYCTRHGSPILISQNEHGLMISSEYSGFCGLVNNYIVLENEDICVASLADDRIHMETRQEYAQRRTCDDAPSTHLSPHPYPHWTLKEIHEQTQSILNAINLGGRICGDGIRLGGLDAHKNKLREIEHMILLGCGTSYHAARIGAFYLKRLTQLSTVQVYDGAEFAVADLPKRGRAAVAFLSQSGETQDLYRCIRMLRDHDEDILLIGVVNVVDSLIAREVDCGCYLNAGREVGVASTKAFTSQVVVLSLIAAWFSQVQDVHAHSRLKHLNDIRLLSHQMQNLLTALDEERVRERIVNRLNSSSLFVLGKGIMEPLCHEGSLKIKEIAYIHAEGYSGSSLKHGPFALLEDTLPVILIITEAHGDKMKNVLEQVKSRSSRLILITDDEALAREYSGILVPYNAHYSCILVAAVLQFIAYTLSVAKRINPDLPKNLAKVVTVE